MWNLDAGGGTNRINNGSWDEPVTAIFVYGRPAIQIVSGDDQRGATNGRLAEPLTVTAGQRRERQIAFRWRSLRLIQGMGSLSRTIRLS